MLDTLFGTTEGTSITISGALITLVAALIIGGIISFTYKRTSKEGSSSNNLTLTLILLPAIIAIIILFIGSNVARAFSLAGAFSIIRFRSAPGEPKDIAYVLFTLAGGLACGIGMIGYGLLLTIILCTVMVILDLTHFTTKANRQVLQITIPEDLDFQGVFDDVFDIYTQGYELRKVKTAALGSLYHLTYLITLKNEVNTKEFLDTIRCRNGNLNISLSLYSEAIDF